MFYMGQSMVKVANKNIIIYVLLFVFGNILTASGNISVAQNIRSPINGKYILPANSQSVFPSASILGSLNEINNMDCSFFVSLGDNFRRADDIQIINYKKSFCKSTKFSNTSSL